MTREEIIQRVLLMDPEQLRQVKRFLDLLQGLSENQTGEPAQVPEEDESG